MGLEIAQTGLLFVALSFVVIRVFNSVENAIFRAFWVGVLFASVGATAVGILIDIWSN